MLLILTVLTHRPWAGCLLTPGKRLQLRQLGQDDCSSELSQELAGAHARDCSEEPGPAVMCKHLCQHLLGAKCSVDLWVQKRTRSWGIFSPGKLLYKCLPLLSDYSVI